MKVLEREAETPRTDTETPVNITVSIGDIDIKPRTISWRKERTAHIDWMARLSDYINTHDPCRTDGRRRYLLHGFRVGMKQPTKFQKT